MRKIIITIFLMLSLALGVSAEDGDGGYAGSYLRVPMGARPVGMGGAYISLSNDGAGAFYNPAGLSMINKKVFSTSYRVMDLDRKLGYASFLIPTQGNSVLGFNWLYASSGAVEARNSDGDPLDYELEMHNHAFSVIFAKRFENYFSAGFSGSYLYTRFAEMVSYSIRLNFGATFYLSNVLMGRETADMFPIQDIQAGIIVRNLASEMRWNNEKYYAKNAVDIYGSEQNDLLPVEVGLGLSARFFNRKLLGATDVVKNAEQGFELHVGAEYFVTPQFSLRAGLSDKNPTAGFGYVFSVGKQTLAIDYAFSGEKVNEGSEHIFSFDWLF